MIRVRLAPEPRTFETQVRIPGLRAIAALVGEAPAVEGRGRPRRAIARERADIPAAAFPPYWRNATDDLLGAYDRVCAYACLYIYPVTGAASVDHWFPKSRRWNQVYEWDNYRLACSIMNSRKNDCVNLLDPFDVTAGLFALDLISLKACPGPSAKGRKARAVRATIRRLGLDGSDYSEALADYYHDYMDGLLPLRLLERRAPFLASELRRQGKLRSAIYTGPRRT